MSQTVEPFPGRGNPRWSAVPLHVPASNAELDVVIACVSVGPPLLARPARAGSVVTAGVPQPALLTMRFLLAAGALTVPASFLQSLPPVELDRMELVRFNAAGPRLYTPPPVG